MVGSTPPGAQRPSGWQADGTPAAWLPDGPGFAQSTALGQPGAPTQPGMPTQPGAPTQPGVPTQPGQPPFPPAAGFPVGPAAASWSPSGPSAMAGPGRFGGAGTGYGRPVGPAGGFVTPRTEPTAVAGFICSFLMWPVGLVLSIVGLARTGRPGSRGRGLAVAGLLISLMAAVLSVLAASIVVPVYLNQRQIAQETQVTSALGSTRDWLLTTQARNGAFPMALDSTAPATGDVSVRLVVDAAGGAPCLDATLGSTTMVASPQNGYQPVPGSCG
ncbi:MAG: hypothetical protein L6367_09550 [Cellulomonas sp.]|nr:hypothetical protein [Cellulomonas sp.]